MQMSPFVVKKKKETREREDTISGSKLRLPGRVLEATWICIGLVYRVEYGVLDKVAVHKTYLLLDNGDQSSEITLRE